MNILYTCVSVNELYTYITFAFAILHIHLCCQKIRQAIFKIGFMDNATQIVEMFSIQNNSPESKKKMYGKSRRFIFWLTPDIFM